jgi:glycosyltransferase involved in cell wall biosynthesis
MTTCCSLDISVVICTYTQERWGDLEAAVASIRDQSLTARETVVVVDHEPQLLERCGRRWPDMKVVDNNGSAGLSSARNSGVAASEGEVVAFLDDDARARADWLQTIAAGYADPSVIGVGGHVAADWEEARPAWFPPEFDWVVGCSYTGLPGEPCSVRNLIGANMSFRREVLDALGGFRPALGRVGARPSGCEETDLCIRALSRYPASVILYDPRARVDHGVPRSRARLRYFVERCRAEGRSKALLAGLVGSGHALSSERSYVRHTLTAGVRRDLGAALRGDRPRMLRAGAIGLGLATTGTGYLAGRREARGEPAEGGETAGGGRQRVLVATPRYPPDVGGVERHVFEVSRRVAAGGKEVTVLCTDPSGRMPERERSGSLTVRRVRAWPAGRDYHFAPRIYREIARGRWDLVHVQSYHTFVAPLAMLAALRHGIPYVVTFHGGGHSSPLRRALRGTQLRLLRPLLARAERLIAVARFEVELYGSQLGLPPERFALIPNGTDFAPSEPPRSTAVNGSVIASVGRLERYKGHHRVLDALPEILRTRPEARLWIAGSGPYEDALRRRAQRLGVADSVEIASAPDPQAMRARLAAAQLVVLMSDFETHPLAALEAVALGKPLLVADGSGLGELADRGLARAVSARSTPQELARAILHELEQPHVPPAVTLPSWDECAEAVAALYDSVNGQAS